MVAEDPRSSTPGERRLERPPSERYAPAVEGEVERSTPSPTRGLALGFVTALGGAVAITLAGGVMTITAGLLVIAAVIGWAVALAVVSGAGTSLGGDRRAALAGVVAVGAIGLGQVGLWLLSRKEGGVLPLLDYLGETWGILVPLELAIGATAAWLRAR